MNKQLYCYLRLCYSCHRYFEDNINNTKRIWDGINSLINRKKKNRKSIGSIRLDRMINYLRTHLITQIS